MFAVHANKPRENKSAGWYERIGYTMYVFLIETEVHVLWAFN
jgi:hypothetical protein